MAWRWGTRSKAVLAECDPALVDVASLALSRSPWDLMAREGIRDKATQDLYFRMGLSQLRFPHSAHNASPGFKSRAIHIIPLPLSWSDHDRFVQTSGLMLSCSWELLGPDQLIWGGDWRSLRDLAHYELAGKPPWRIV